ncbi:MAG: GNAT family N-acetyltransferase [Novosphingobium sp.]
MIETARLVLRSWRDDDLEPFAAMSADPKVMATLGPLMTRDETAALIARLRGLEARDGHTFWAVEHRADQRMIGFCGAIRGTAGPVDGKAEIGWRLARDCWGLGLASEAARAVVDWAFANLDDRTVWAITSVDNLRSRAVMDRLGMVYRPEFDFDHPNVPEGDPLCAHVTYSLECIA